MASHYCSQFLCESKASPYAVISYLDRYMTAVALRTPTPPQMTWDASMEKLSYHGKVMSMPTIRDGLQKALRDCSDLLKEVARGAPIDETNLPNDMTENLKDRTYGTGWIDKAEVDSMAVLRELCKDETFYCIDASGRVRIRQEAGMSWLLEAGKVVVLLLSLIHVTGGQPGRATEMAEVLIRNKGRDPGIRKDFGSTFITTYYNKNTSEHGGDVFVARLLPQQVAECLDKYLLYIRPVEMMIARAVFQDSAKVVDNYRFYLFTVGGERLEGDRLSAHFSEFAMKYFLFDGCGFRVWRQLVIAMCREHIEPSYWRLIDNHAGDLQAGHGTSTGRASYGRSLDEHEYLTTDLFIEYARYSRSWHVVLGLVPGEEPPLALRLRSKTHDATFPCLLRREGVDPFRFGAADDHVEERSFGADGRLVSSSGVTKKDLDALERRLAGRVKELVEGFSAEATKGFSDIAAQLLAHGAKSRGFEGGNDRRGAVGGVSYKQPGEVGPAVEKSRVANVKWPTTWSGGTSVSSARADSASGTTAREDKGKGRCPTPLASRPSASSSGADSTLATTAREDKGKGKCTAVWSNGSSASSAGADTTPATAAREDKGKDKCPTTWSSRPSGSSGIREPSSAVSLGKGKAIVPADLVRPPVTPLQLDAASTSTSLLPKAAIAGPSTAVGKKRIREADDVDDEGQARGMARMRTDEDDNDCRVIKSRMTKSDVELDWESLHPYRSSLTNVEELASPRDRNQMDAWRNRLFFDRLLASKLWKPGQALALLWMWKRNEDGSVYIPTGGGKSLLYQFSAKFMFRGKIVVVVIPFREIIRQAMKSSSALGINVWEFVPQGFNAEPKMGEGNIVFVSAERVGSDVFIG